MSGRGQFDDYLVQWINRITDIISDNFGECDTVSKKIQIHIVMREIAMRRKFQIDMCAFIIPDEIRYGRLAVSCQYMRAQYGLLCVFLLFFLVNIRKRVGVVDFGHSSQIKFFSQTIFFNYRYSFCLILFNVHAVDLCQSFDTYHRITVYNHITGRNFHIRKRFADKTRRQSPLR